MTVEQLVTRVRSAIDELTGTGSEILLEDVTNLSRLIVDKIGYALQFVLIQAAIEKLNVSDFAIASSTSLTISEDLVGSVTLPANLLRLVEARLSSWALSPDPQSDRSQVALMQQDPYARGSWDRPVSILSGNTLKMYCAKTSSDTLVMKYIAKPNTTGITIDSPNTSIPVPPLLEGALVYHVAGLVMLAFREEVADKLFGIAAQYMGTNVDINSK